MRVTDGATQVAAGRVDLTGTPLHLQQGRPGVLVLTFPAGSFWVVPSTATATGLRASIAPSSTGAARGGAEQVRTTVTGPLSPVGDLQAAAADALRRQTETDRSDVSTLAEKWGPQLSAKKSGLTADGKVYDDAAVLADHLALRARFPQARLVFSADWTNFQGRDFWITLAGVPEPDPDAALGWCGEQGFDRTQCLAVLISTSRGPQGTSKTR